jgi:hypothetical protein
MFIFYRVYLYVPTFTFLVLSLFLFYSLAFYVTHFFYNFYFFVFPFFLQSSNCCIHAHVESTFTKHFQRRRRATIICLLVLFIVGIQNKLLAPLRLVLSFVYLFFCLAFLIRTREIVSLSLFIL